MFAQPLYHTIHETFYAVKELYDKGFNFHAAITQLWAILGTYIADSQVIWGIFAPNFASFLAPWSGLCAELVEMQNLSTCESLKAKEIGRGRSILKFNPSKTILEIKPKLFLFYINLVYIVSILISSYNLS